MQLPLTALLDLKSLSSSQLQFLFSAAEKVKEERLPISDLGHSIALLFFEPSTRTRLSFQTAAHRIGLGPLVLEANGGNSLEKGETPEDTVLNVAAMGPKIIVVRCGDSVNLAELHQVTKIPMINGGWGMKGHPTQALTDLFTLFCHWGRGGMAQKKLLFTGDAKHSRVVASHLEIFSAAGLEIGYAGPSDLKPAGFSGTYFSSIDEALGWADAVMSLRFQFERYEKRGGMDEQLMSEAYRKEWSLNSQRLSRLKSKGVIMHPGPVNWGLELSAEVAKDPRCLILDQVRHGVWIREAIIRSMLGETFT